MSKEKKKKRCWFCGREEIPEEILKYYEDNDLLRGEEGMTDICVTSEMKIPICRVCEDVIYHLATQAALNELDDTFEVALERIKEYKEIEDRED